MYVGLGLYISEISTKMRLASQTRLYFTHGCDSLESPLTYYVIYYEGGALVPRAFPYKRQFVSEWLNAFKLFTHRTELISILLRFAFSLFSLYLVNDYQ